MPRCPDAPDTPDALGLLFQNVYQGLGPIVWVYMRGIRTSWLAECPFFEEMYVRDGLHLSGKGAAVFAEGLSGAVASGLGKVRYLN